MVAEDLGEDDVVENGDDDRLRIRDRFRDNEDRVLDEKLGENSIALVLLFQSCSGSIVRATEPLVKSWQELSSK